MPNASSRERLFCLLVVEGDESQLHSISVTMAAEGFEVTGCSTVADALDLVNQEEFGVSIVDLKAADLGDTECLKAIHELNEHTRVIVNTAFSDFDSAQHAVDLGVFGEIQKATNPRALLRQVHDALRWRFDRYARDLEAAVTERKTELRAANEELMHEITERKRAEVEREQLAEQLRQTQKLEAIGQLAGGIAHDFNNLLTTILGNAEILIAAVRDQGDQPPIGLLKEGLAQIYSAGERAASLTSQLLSFSRNQIICPDVIDPADIVADMHKMLRRMIGEHIELALNRFSDSGCVRADPAQIEHVIMQLVINAADAMPEGGTISIDVGPIIPREEENAPQIDAPAGRLAAIRVADQGVGMSPEVVKRIFEPFYTTKSAEKAAGLGLSTAYGTVRQLGGNIAVDSTPGKGTVFTVYLPAVSREDAGGQAGESPARAPAVRRSWYVETNPTAHRSHATARQLRAGGIDPMPD